MNISSLGELKKNGVPREYRSVKDEIRANLKKKIQRGEDLFPGIVGYEETVIPGLVNALLARHNLILLGLRGQAKSRILRAMANFLDVEIPVIEGSELNEDPFFPISPLSHERISREGDALPVRWLSREDRYVEKLATPDVTVADIIGDLDPIKAAKSGTHLSALSNVHFGLLPRANRGIFAINELPDLAPKIQVALFNIMQEGDIQIKGFPVRMPLDVLLVFSANPEDYTARGKIITPLKDRIGAEVRTHYPEELKDGIRITANEAWVKRDDELKVEIPDFIYEVVEGIAFAGRRHSRIDQQSGVSQRLPIACLETLVSNAERRGLKNGSGRSVARISDVYASVPSLSGKLELTYEGELKGPEAIIRELIGHSTRSAFERICGQANFDPIIQWFELGGTVQVTDQTSDREYLEKIECIQGLDRLLRPHRVALSSNVGVAVALVEFFLEGLCSQRRLSRNDERGYFREVEEAESGLYTPVEEGKVSFS